MFNTYMFNTHSVIRIYQNISEVLLMPAFILWPSCTCGFGIREKTDAVCGFLAYFCAVLRFSDPPYAPLYLQNQLVAIQLWTDCMDKPPNELHVTSPWINSSPKSTRLVFFWLEIFSTNPSTMKSSY